MLGQGNQKFCFVDYDYRVKLFQLKYTYAFIQRQKWSLDFMTLPQFNLTRYRKFDQVPAESNGFEYGINFGLAFRKSIYKNLISAYAGLSFGPHYISGAPSRQTKGFIFSDNAFIGLSIRLDKHIYFELCPTFRHISNANLIKPNRGINNMIICGGLLFQLD